MNMNIYKLSLCLGLAACAGQDWIDNPAENVPVARQGKADAVGQKLCGTANGLPSNVCRTILDQHDADWHHNVLRSSQGTTIQMDMQPHFLRYRDEWTVGSSTYSEERADWSGQPLWFNISNPAFTGNEHVHAVFLLKRDATVDCSNYEDCDTFELDLTYAGGGRFTAQWQAGNAIYVSQQLIRSDGTNTIATNAEEIAVVIDGNWQDDPISGSHNFKFDLSAGLDF
jgi:hypothetical protein